MSVACQTLYNDCARLFGTGTSDARLQADFVRAVNRSLDELSLDADLATKHSHINSIGATVTTLDDEYEFVLATGMEFHMTRMGHRPSDPRLAALVYKDTGDRWVEAKAAYTANEMNEAQAAGISRLDQRRQRRLFL